MKISIILGTRPEIIKLAPIVKELEKRNIEFFILHTGQHHSYNMDHIFFQQLQLPDPKYNLELGSGIYAEQTAKMLTGIEQVPLKEKPDIVIVQGDTNTTLAGALAAAKLQIPVAHVEAGLRSFDMSMPEEINRVLVDHISTLLFAPTEISRKNLEREAITEGVYVTGNTIVDSIYRYLLLTEKATLHLNPPQNYALITLYRQENVDNPQRLANAIKGVEMAAEKLSITIIFSFTPEHATG
jgi:UDP-N-acetylglucosamine 2-epimerase (non-hydrolysing)